jgi:tetratricopeptide (TPR) repeat protein
MPFGANALDRTILLRRPARLLGKLALLAVLAAYAEPAEATDSITVLEPVFVEASSGNPWYYFNVPGFEVISHCSESFNQTYARALELSTAARLAVLPASFWGDMPTPMKVVLYNREPERSGAFNQGNPIDLDWRSGDGRSVGSGTIEHSYPVTVGDGDTYINCGNYWSVQATIENFSVDPDSDLRIRNRVPRLPSWFVTGMEGPFGLYPNRIIQSSAFSDVAVLPSATWISTSETLAILSEPKDRHRDGKDNRLRKMLTLAELFAGTTPDKKGIWDSEVSLFVRWGLYASGKRQAFLDLVDRASREPATEAMFQETMGMSYAEAQLRLGDYLPTAVSQPIRVPINLAHGKSLDIREASATEVARIIGDWGRMEGQSLGAGTFDGGMHGMGNFEYQRDCLDQADRLFQKIYRRHTSDPLFLAAYGLYELQAGDNIRALDALEAATNAGVLRPRAYVELARLRLENALPSNQAGIGDLDEPEFERILGLLTTARVQMPSLLATYDLLARVLEHAPAIPSLEQIRPLEEALGLFPQNAALAYKVANFYREIGMGDKGAAVIRRSMRFSDSAQGRALLAEFLAKKSN